MGRRILSLIAAAVACFALVGCGTHSDSPDASDSRMGGVYVVPAGGGGAPSGAAGGDLSGTYPNPSVIAATASTAGKVQLAGDLGGSSAAPRVLQLTGDGGVVTMPSGTSLAAGTNPATAGILRLPAATALVEARNNANSANLSIVATDSSDQITIGGTGIAQFISLATLHTFSSTAGTHFLQVDGAGVHCASPLIGSANDSFPLKLGVAAIVMSSDADFTPSAAQYSQPALYITSSVSLTATRKILINVTNTGAFFFVFNGTAGGQSLLINGAGGTGAAIVNGKAGLAFSEGTNFRGGSLN